MVNVAYQNNSKSPYPLATRYGDNIIQNEFPIISEFDELMILELSNSALKEVFAMARMGEPVWIPDLMLGNKLVVNEQEYFKLFQTEVTPKPIGIGYKFEASRECDVIVNIVLSTLFRFSWSW